MKVSTCYCLQLGCQFKSLLVSVRRPLKLLKEKWLSENTKGLNLLDYVSKVRDKLKRLVSWSNII